MPAACDVDWTVGATFLIIPQSGATGTPLYYPHSQALPSILSDVEDKAKAERIQLNMGRLDMLMHTAGKLMVHIVAR